MLLCILDGSEYMFLVAQTWLSWFCRVALSLCCCCHFPDDDASSRSGSRHEESQEGSKLWVWGKQVASLLEHVVLKVYSILLSFPVEWISLDMTCRLLDRFMGLFMFHCWWFGKITRRFWFCLSWWIIPQKGVRSVFEILRKCVSQNLSMSWA